jgi:SAM-dependent methyltransferase
MSGTWEKFAQAAEGWSSLQYADPRAYLARRAELVRALGPPLVPGDTVLDLACGDGGFADFFPEHRYIGVDASPEMVAAALAHGREVVHADLNDYVPPEPVAVTTMFRAIYYARDRGAFLGRLAAYTEKKIVFDLNPRTFDVSDVRAELRTTGLDGFAMRPFFMPQTRALSRLALDALRAAERTTPFARLLLRRRFSYVCAAWRTGSTASS